MDKDITFSYNYSAKQNKEIEEIRQKYLPKTESKFEELRRLDLCVQSAGIPESLCAGVGGFLLFGLGICLAVQIIGGGLLLTVLGVLLGIIGSAGMLIAYPLHTKIFNSTKAKFAPRILELTEELSANK